MWEPSTEATQKSGGVCGAAYAPAIPSTTPADRKGLPRLEDSFWESAEGSASTMAVTASASRRARSSRPPARRWARESIWGRVRLRSRAIGITNAGDLGLRAGGNIVPYAGPGYALDGPGGWTIPSPTLTVLGEGYIMGTSPGARTSGVPRESRPQVAGGEKERGYVSELRMRRAQR